ncbi:MAG: SLATT domain-containing protein, partial [Gemmatimonadaceae bacterium]|nr:SLATT domain-containing protein [Gemmatimonadaceae bacterium]
VSGGNPFPIGDSDANLRLIHRLDEIATKVADLVVVEVATAPISHAMNEARAASLDERVTRYQLDRIRGQMSWYAGKSALNTKLAFRWTLASISLQMLALVLGIVGISQDWDFDFVGVFSAISVSAVAWMAVRQHEVLARSYAVASRELSTIDARISASAAWSESDWAEFVDQAEEAISREHTSWRASRGTV